MDKQHDKRIRRARRRAEGKNTHHIDSLKTIQKKYQTEKRQAMMEKWILVQEIHLHSRQTSTRNGRMLIRSTCTRMDDKRKGHIYQEEPYKKNHPTQLQTHKLLTDMCKILKSQIREDIYYSLSSHGSFPEEPWEYCKDPELRESYFT